MKTVILPVRHTNVRGFSARQKDLVRRLDQCWLAVRHRYRARYACRRFMRLIRVADAWGMEVFVHPDTTAGLAVLAEVFPEASLGRHKAPQGCGVDQ